ncbi:MAG: DUF1800 domain-containing protein, partial [Erythrobacter sp.]
DAIAGYFAFRQLVREGRDNPAGKKVAQEARRKRSDEYITSVQVRAQIAIDSRAPVAERLVHFWANHFSVSVAKRRLMLFAAPHEAEAIRPHVMGRFSDMLKAAVLHPAMLIYLDQFNSLGPNSQAMQNRIQRGRAQGGEQINENLAREVLELHSLGVGGGYSQADIIELAKALTGWTVPSARAQRRVERQPNGAIFATSRHEPGARRVLGRNYAEGGASQALSILDDLAKHPSTARFVATKLARHFTQDTPDPKLIARLEQAFMRSGGDLPTVYRALINAPESWEQTPRKFRQPWEWLIAVHRGTGTAIKNPRAFSRLLVNLGQRPWGPISPAGFDDKAASWAGSEAVMRRVNIANALARRAPSLDVVELAEQWFPESLSQTSRLAIGRAESPQQGLTLLLASPEMLRR